MVRSMDYAGVHSQVVVAAATYAHARIDSRGRAPDYAPVETLGAVLRSARESRGLTRRLVDRATGLAEGNIYRWETGVNPDPVPLMKLLAFYGLSPTSVLQRMGELTSDLTLEDVDLGLREAINPEAMAAELEALADAHEGEAADLHNDEDRPPDENQDDLGQQGHAG